MALMREGSLKMERFTEKERRNLAILDIIRRSREISRAEISKITHLNIVTISNYVDDYIRKGIVLEKGLDVSSGGRRPELLQMNAKYGYAIGIDLGSPQITKDAAVVAVLVDSVGRTVARHKIAKLEEGQEELIKKAVSVVSEVVSKAKVPADKLRGIGIGIWGVLDRYKGTVRYAVEKGGLFNYFELQSMFERKFDLPTLVEHDATAGVLGERWMGMGISADADNIIYMCSDSSCGLILNGDLYYGSSKSAGELNLNPPSQDYKDDNCWAKYDYGCGFRSRGIDLGISARAKAFIKNKESSKILSASGGKAENITLDIVIEAAKQQDAFAVELLKDAGDYLGAKIAYLINLFNPDAIVIGRGIEKCGDVFLNAVKNSIKKWAYEESLKVVRIVPTTLGEDSVACGASALVLQQMFAKI